MKINIKESVDTKELTETIRQLCIEKYGSVDCALKTAGLDKSVVDNLKKGSLPNIAVLKILSETFNVSADYLLGLTKKSPTVMAGLNENTSKIQLMFDKMNEQQQQLIMQFAEILLDEPNNSTKIETIFTNFYNTLDNNS